jgi:N-methylhydantoinase B
MPEATQDRIIDDNIMLRDVDGKPAHVCRHCGVFIAAAGSSWRDHLPTTFLGPPSTAGPHLNDNARQYLDVDVRLRQGYCPGCFTALFTETVPAAATPEGAA